MATITRENASHLKLQEGSKVVALVKTSSIILISEAEDLRFSAHNQFSGTISRVQQAAVSTGIVMSTGNNGSLALLIINDSAPILSTRTAAVSRPFARLSASSSAKPDCR